jgi:aspartyl-tRNA(Asn)/glutamyl-tRNA(Gln) amidotransferase subunit C
MELTLKDVRKIAKLARLRLNEDEVETYYKEISSVLSWFEKIHSKDLTGVEPTYNPTNEFAPMREDVVSDGSQQQAVLKNAPSQYQGYFVVPKVI